MGLADRVLNYRAKHNLSRERMDDLLQMSRKTTLTIETRKPMQMRRIRFAEMRMDELEEKDRCSNA